MKLVAKNRSNLLSSLLELLAFTSLTLGTYVEGGRGPALFVGGFCLILVALALDGIQFGEVTKAFWQKVRSVKSEPKRRRVVQTGVLTNADISPL